MGPTVGPKAVKQRQTKGKGQRETLLSFPSEDEEARRGVGTEMSVHGHGEDHLQVEEDSDYWRQF